MADKYFEIWFQDGSEIHPSPLFKDHELKEIARRFDFNDHDLLQNGCVDLIEDGDVIGGVHTVYIQLQVNFNLTGKTTFLKNKVDELINGGHCRADEIGYFSFTVKAAEEIRDRVTKEEWSEAELKKMFPYFCTLHSLAYKRLQLQQSQIMDQSDYDDLSRDTGRFFVNKMKKGNGMDISMPTFLRLQRHSRKDSC